jgi:hypothetical protein
MVVAGEWQALENDRRLRMAVAGECFPCQGRKAGTEGGNWAHPPLAQLK